MKRLEAFVEQPVDFRAPIGESVRKPTSCHFVVPMGESVGVGFVTSMALARIAAVPDRHWLAPCDFEGLR